MEGKFDEACVIYQLCLHNAALMMLLLEVGVWKLHICENYVARIVAE